MSVLVLEKSQYEKVLNTLVFYGYIDRMSMKYLCTLRRHNIDSEKFLPELVVTWLILNERSYDIKYKGPMNNNPIQLKLGSKGSISNELQFLKALKCIDYNIEADTIAEIIPLSVKEERACKILKEIIHEIQSKIILELPEYDKCKWSDF
jgi:hypothetical protein